MASGEIVVHILREIPPGSSAAILDLRVGASSPPEAYPVYKFGSGANSYLDFLCELNGYGGNGLTFDVPWSAETATTGNVGIGIAIRRIAFDSDDVDVSHSYDYNSVTDAAPGTNGHVTNPTISFTNGADMDSWAEGELAIVRVRRDVSVGSNMSGNMQLWALIGRET